MRIAFLGATSQIAKDLTLSFCAQSGHELVLYARRPEAVSQWLASVDLPKRFPVHEFAAFTAAENFDAVFNFVGVGNPAQAASIGASIFDLTLQFDELALNYLRMHSGCRYIFLSSGAAYGSNFNTPVDATTSATIAINHLQPQDWYSVSKLHAECRHRSLKDMSIVDIRIFNYFSHLQDMEARFLITDIARSIRDRTVFKTSAEYMVRDFIGPDDFYQLINSILNSPCMNAVLDCYSKAPIDKPTLLAAMKAHFDLHYELVQSSYGVNATGNKPYYYSVNKHAAEFGYSPTLSSLECIEKELRMFMKENDRGK